ncbi:G2/mitotic-specific cyclin-B2-like [Salarias fasciatus]|uniref:G2/mitotic-specific cyclin-B2-like n=1 Tax=Salarias fasciatus TaxID=181472 RepID=UPI00117652EF|nr:G2/mitotic-specific cyclin-B2-like [Salarias fasciatus]
MEGGLSAQSSDNVAVALCKASGTSTAENGHGLQHACVASALHRNTAKAMEKLGISDRIYAWDVLLVMMRSQVEERFSDTGLPVFFTEDKRAALVDWIIEIHYALDFEEETLYLTIDILKRSLSLIKVTRNNLQLLAVVCLFVAAKKEESHIPTVSSLCALLNNAYTKKQLLRMEQNILLGLKFRLSLCSPPEFLCVLGTELIMAKYLSELLLLDAQCDHCLSLDVAAAALRLAHIVLQEPSTAEKEAAWSLASIFQFGRDTVIKDIMLVLANAAAKAHLRGTSASFIKYSSPIMMSVSRHQRLSQAPSLLKE